MKYLNFYTDLGKLYILVEEGQMRYQIEVPREEIVRMYGLLHPKPVELPDTQQLIFEAYRKGFLDACNIVR